MRAGGRIESGVLGCDCCAFPIVAGIPVMIADDTTRDAMHQLEAGRATSRRSSRCSASTTHAATAFRALLASRPPGDLPRRPRHPQPRRRGGLLPVPLLGSHVPDDAGAAEGAWPEPVDRVAAGARSLRRLGTPDARAGGLAPAGGTVDADVYFWKLWLAKRFTSPGCDPVCCDANSPLPFARDTFSMVVLADAFPYIWHKRLLAEEMMRARRAGRGRRDAAPAQLARRELFGGHDAHAGGLPGSLRATAAAAVQRRASVRRCPRAPRSST